MYFFIRFANIVAGSSESDSILWKLVKETKAMYLMSQNWEQLNKCEGELLSTKELMDLFVQNMNASKESNDNSTVNENDLEKSGEMFIYLISCPSDETLNVLKILKKESSSDILKGLMKKILSNEKSFDIPTLLYYIVDLFEFQYLTRSSQENMYLMRNLSNISGFKFFFIEIVEYVYKVLRLVR